MKNKNTLIITTVICLLPIILAIAIYSQLPEQVAIHFDNNGNPDNYLPKALAAFGLPVFIALINIYGNFFRNKDPKTANVPTAMKSLATWLIPLLSVVLVPFTLFMAMGVKLPFHIPIQSVIGLIIIACGNYMPKTKHNYTVGIKLPWTLDSETNWNKTHHFSGYLWIIGGIIIIITSFINLNLLPLNIIVIIILVAAPIIYSYLMYKKEMRNNQN